MAVSFCLSVSLLPLTKEEVNVFARVCLSVCWQDYSKTRTWIWMKCCVSTDVGTWTNWLTFEPDPDYCPDAETGLLSLIYKHTTRNFTWEKSHTYWRRGFWSEPWFYSLSCWITFVGGTCALPSAVLVRLFVCCLSVANAY